MFTEVYHVTTQFLVDAFELCYTYVDLYYLSWLAWVFYPLVLTLILPVCLFLFVYGSSIFLHIYRLRHIIKDNSGQDYWQAAKQTICAVWDAQGKVWHGYEVHGIDKIPDSGPALLVFYHGALPLDFYYMVARLHLLKNRRLAVIGDRFLFKIPGFRLLMEVFNVLPGTVSKGVEIMKEGHLLAVAPGGVREALFSDEYYGLVWGKRHGFAKIAIEAQVPVIPLFTQNCREVFRSLGFGRSILRWIYERTRLPIVPLYGGFPSKLRTFVGDPIYYDPSLNAEQLASKVQLAIQDLIKKHQQVPGNILRALMERFYTPQHCKQD